MTGIHWLIVGGESGTQLWKPEIRAQRALATPNGHGWVPRADRVDWVRSLRARCEAVGTVFFFKQWGGAFTSAAGHLLDGQEYRSFPA
jgi:protein gp37